MIKIVFKKKSNNFVYFEVKGHSNLSALGTDIVCSAVSSSSFMVLNGIIEILKLDVEYLIDEGHIMCNLKELYSDKTNILIESFYLLVEEMQKQYPKNLKFKVMEV